MPEQIGQKPRIETRKCNPIPLEMPWLITNEEIIETMASIDKKYSDRERRKDRKGPTGQYNCHGLTFLNRRAWMHPTAISLVLVDDEYFKIEDLSAVKPGDIAVYYTDDQHNDIDHTGVVVNIERPYRPSGIILPGSQKAMLKDQTIWILSKWGNGPEVEHPVDYGPYSQHIDHIVYLREGRNDIGTDYNRN